jgi:large subunit ribosomal protein L15
MKLHDLRPADGSRQPRTRVGRGIAAGKGKTAGRGTKGQKARAGGSIPPWFEGGQTPLHMRIPKLRGFKNRFKIEYEVVNIGAIGALADGGAFEFEGDAKKSTKSAPITVNQDILRAVGLVRTLNKPLKILGAGELSVALFVVADAFTGSARAKIEAAGGSVNVLEVPSSPLAALGVTPAETPARKPADKAASEAPTRKPAAKAEVTDAVDGADAETETETPADEKPAAKAATKADEPTQARTGAKSGKASPKATADGTPKAKTPTRKPRATATEAAETSEPEASAAIGEAAPPEPDAPPAADTDEPAAASEAVAPSDDDA